MGGLGSGKRGWGWKPVPCTDDHLQIDERNWQRAGVLKPGAKFIREWRRCGEVKATLETRADADYVDLVFQTCGNGGWLSVDIRLRLDWTPCNYGGHRPWFLCPMCSRRVAVLYSGAAFACRQCRGLAYPTQRQSAVKRATLEAQRIRESLGGTRYFTDPLPLKPKGMHWRTYWGLIKKYNDLVSVFAADLGHRVCGMEKRLRALGTL